MKKYLPFLIALFFCTTVMGQHIPEKNTLAWSNPISNKKKATYSKFIGENEDGVFVTKTTIKQETTENWAFPVLEVYDHSFSLLQSQKLDIKEGKGKIIYENTILIGGNLYLFYSLAYVWNQSITLMVQPLDTKTLQAVGEPKKIMETKSPTVSTRDQFTDFKFYYSEDNLSLLISNMEPSGGNKMQKIHLYALKGSIDQAWEREIELPYQVKMFEMVSQSIDNNGDVYLLGTKYLVGNTAKRNGKPNYDYVLLGYTHDGIQDFAHNIGSKDKFFMDMRIGITPKSEIICTGFYSNGDTYSVAGNYYLKFERGSGSVLHERYTDFSLDFLTQNLDKKDAKKAVKRTKKGKGDDSFAFSLNDLLLRKDGSVTLVGEKILAITINTINYPQPKSLSRPNMKTTSTSKYYSYEDIIAVHLSPEGELEWAEKIPKMQNTTGDFGFFSSYALASDQDNLYFIFNDNPKNLHNMGKGTLANFNPRRGTKNAALAMVTLDAKGKKSKELLAQPQNSTVLIKPQTSRQFSPGNLFLFAQYKKDFRLAKLEF